MWHLQTHEPNPLTSPVLGIESFLRPQVRGSPTSPRDLSLLPWALVHLPLTLTAGHVPQLQVCSEGSTSPSFLDLPHCKSEAHPRLPHAGALEITTQPSFAGQQKRTLTRLGRNPKKKKKMQSWLQRKYWGEKNPVSLLPAL